MYMRKGGEVARSREGEGIKGSQEVSNMFLIRAGAASALAWNLILRWHVGCWYRFAVGLTPHFDMSRKYSSPVIKTTCMTHHFTLKLH